MPVVDTAVGPLEIGGSPSDAEVAAIVAAIEMSWPQPVAPSTRGPVVTSTAWRHADRWWAAGRLPAGWSSISL